MDTDSGSAVGHLSPSVPAEATRPDGDAPLVGIDLTEVDPTPAGGVPDEFLANVMRASVNPYAVLDHEGVVRFVSEPIVEILGLTAAECVGRSVLDFIDPRHQIVVATAIAEFINPDRDDEGWTGPPISVDLVHADGHRVPCRVLGVGSGTPGFHGVVVRIRQTSTTAKLDAAIAGMITSGDLAEVIGLILDVLVDQMPGSAAAVGIGWDGRSFARTVATTDAPPIGVAGDAEDIDPPWAAAILDGTHAVADVGALPERLATTAAAAGWASCWAFPVAIAGACEEALVVWRKPSGAPTQHLREAVDRMIQLVQLAFTAHHSRRTLEHQARTDPLTGLANRLALFDRIEELGRQEDSSSIGVLYCDLDDFKPINDRFGHGTGDRVLTIAAHRIASQVRAGDLVARLGGDEFAVLCVGADTARLAGLARRLLRSFDEPIVIDGQSVHVGLSVGSALLDDTRTRSAASILHEADHALLAAKAGGKGTWRSAPQHDAADAGPDAEDGADAPDGADHAEGRLTS